VSKLWIQTRGVGADWRAPGRVWRVVFAALPGGSRPARKALVFIGMPSNKHGINA
jgi:hypothetical protein